MSTNMPNNLPNQDRQGAFGRDLQNGTTYESRIGVQPVEARAVSTGIRVSPMAELLTVMGLAGRALADLGNDARAQRIEAKRNAREAESDVYESYLRTEADLQRQYITAGPQDKETYRQTYLDFLRTSWESPNNKVATHSQDAYRNNWSQEQISIARAAEQADILASKMAHAEEKQQNAINTFAKSVASEVGGNVGKALAVPLTSADYPVPNVLTVDPERLKTHIYILLNDSIRSSPYASQIPVDENGVITEPALRKQLQLETESLAAEVLKDRTKLKADVANKEMVAEIHDDANTITPGVDEFKRTPFMLNEIADRRAVYGDAQDLQKKWVESRFKSYVSMVTDKRIDPATAIQAIRGVYEASVPFIKTEADKEYRDAVGAVGNSIASSVHSNILKDPTLDPMSPLTSLLDPVGDGGTTKLDTSFAAAAIQLGLPRYNKNAPLGSLSQFDTEQMTAEQKILYDALVVRRNKMETMAREQEGWKPGQESLRLLRSNYLSGSMRGADNETLNKGYKNTSLALKATSGLFSSDDARTAAQYVIQNNLVDASEHGDLADIIHQGIIQRVPKTMGTIARIDTMRANDNITLPPAMSTTVQRQLDSNDPADLAMARASLGVIGPFDSRWSFDGQQAAKAALLARTPTDAEYLTQRRMIGVPTDGDSKTSKKLLGDPATFSLEKQLNTSLSGIVPGVESSTVLAVSSTMQAAIRSEAMIVYAENKDMSRDQIWATAVAQFAQKNKMVPVVERGSLTFVYDPYGYASHINAINKVGRDSSVPTVTANDMIKDRLSRIVPEHLQDDYRRAFGVKGDTKGWSVWDFVKSTTNGLHSADFNKLEFDVIYDQGALQNNLYEPSAKRGAVSMLASGGPVMAFKAGDRLIPLTMNGGPSSYQLTLNTLIPDFHWYSEKKDHSRENISTLEKAYTVDPYGEFGSRRKK